MSNKELEAYIRWVEKFLGEVKEVVGIPGTEVSLIVWPADAPEKGASISSTANQTQFRGMERAIKTVLDMRDKNDPSLTMYGKGERLQ